MNRLFLTDSYKVTHYKQYPPGTTNVYSYFESRGHEAPLDKIKPDVLFFGLQYILKRFLCEPLTPDEVYEASEIYGSHLGPEFFNQSGMQHIIDEHGGRFPLSIRA